MYIFVENRTREEHNAGRSSQRSLNSQLLLGYCNCCFSTWKWRRPRVVEHIWQTSSLGFTYIKLRPTKKHRTVSVSYTWERRVFKMSCARHEIVILILNHSTDSWKTHRWFRIILNDYFITLEETCYYCYPIDNQRKIWTKIKLKQCLCQVDWDAREKHHPLKPLRSATSQVTHKQSHNHFALCNSGNYFGRTAVIACKKTHTFSIGSLSQEKLESAQASMKRHFVTKV